MIKTKKQRTTLGYAIKNNDKLGELLQIVTKKQGNITNLCRNAGMARRTFYRLSRSRGLISAKSINKICSTLRVQSEDFFKPQVSSKDNDK